MAINEERFFRWKSILFEEYEDMNAVNGCLCDLDNDEAYPKDRWIEDWREIIKFCREKEVTDEPVLLDMIERWAEEVGV